MDLKDYQDKSLARLAAFLRAAQEHGIPVWSEVELAWRLRPRVGGLGR